MMPGNFFISGSEGTKAEEYTFDNNSVMPELTDKESKLYANYFRESLTEIFNPERMGIASPLEYL